MEMSEWPSGGCLNGRREAARMAVGRPLEWLLGGCLNVFQENFECLSRGCLNVFRKSFLQ